VEGPTLRRGVGRQTDDELQGNCCGLTEVLTRDLPAGTEKYLIRP
jgi:hypothetical protein